jgi:ethanolamine utilization protein EutN
MLVGRVVGTVVATQKNPKIVGAKLLLVQPTTPSGEDAGPTLLAVDSVGAGPGERVLVVLEGKSAVQAHGVPLTPIDAAIVAIVDHIDTP